MEKEQIVGQASDPEALERTVCYLAANMKKFLRRGDQVLICFPDDRPDALGSLFKQAVLRCEARPIIWGPDYRWKTLLRQAFFCKASVIVAPPLVILGLTKLARAKSLPLYVRHVVTAGYPCTDWVIEGIINGLDCKTWGCFDLDHPGVVAGFSCGRGYGVHLREEEYGVLILDKHGKPVADGEMGEIWIYHNSAPERLMSTGDSGRVRRGKCTCGSAELLVTDFWPTPGLDRQLFQATQEIMQWTSVLDCRIKRGQAGLEIEIVIFPGEKLPVLPSCAKLIVRPWEPETDVPFWSLPEWKYQDCHGESY